MTSIADSARRPTGLAWLRAALLLVLLAAVAALCQPPWGWLWLIVPAAVALSLLLSWRFGAWGLTVPVVLAAGVLAAGHGATPWTWWIPTAALCGRVDGTARRGAGERLGRPRVAAPAAPGAGRVAAAHRAVRRAWSSMSQTFVKQWGDGMVQMGREVGYTGERLAVLERDAQDLGTASRQFLPSVAADPAVSVGRGAGVRGPFAVGAHRPCAPVAAACHAAACAIGGCRMGRCGF